jgi:Ca2+/H+ antiporter
MQPSQHLELNRLVKHCAACTLTHMCVQDGNSNWLKGVLLLVTYVLVAAGFWMHKDTDLSQEDVDAAHKLL